LVPANRDEESVVSFNREGKEFQLMRLIRKLLVLTLVGVAGVAAYAYWSDNGSILRAKATEVAAAAAKREAGKLASEAVDKGRDAAGHFGDTVTEATLTAKIKSKMALDDHVKARAINVDTEGSVATLTGVVTSTDERKRAVQLARDTEGITRVVDKLKIERP
jgi:osmotically-inducible protein OsmY